MNKIAVAAIIIAAVGIAGALASPLFYETEIDEEIPLVLERMPLDEFSNMDEAERDKIIETMSEDEKTAIMAELMEEAAESGTEVSEEMDDGGVTVLKSGSFEGLYGHAAEGTAKIIEVGGVSYLRFEDFSVTNGPDLKVYLTPTGNINDGVRLADLKGSRGAQNYELAGIDRGVQGFVVIYCQPFHVYFAQAELT